MTTDLEISANTALSIILDRTGWGCASTTSGLGSCFKDKSRSIHAKYTSEQVCDSCVAALALGCVNGEGRVSD